jgi:hypothetical protein
LPSPIVKKMILHPERTSSYNESSHFMQKMIKDRASQILPLSRTHFVGFISR